MRCFTWSSWPSWKHRGGEDGGGQVRDGQQRTVDDFTGERERRGRGRATRCPANATLVILLDPAKDRDAVGTRLGVDGLVVVAAEQHQVGVLVPVLVGHRGDAPWPLAAVGDDVRHLAQEGGVVIGVAWFEEPLVAAGEGADAPGEGDQRLHLFVGNVSAHRAQVDD